jgi:threonine dehydratase
MIIAGQGTAVLELLEEQPDLDALVLCVGGGGLIAGSALIAKSIRPEIRIFGVEPENANDTFLSLAKGERVTIDPPDTIADGLRSPSPGKLTFPVIQQFVESILLVSDAEIRAAARFLLERVKILSEPSGVVGLAAALFDKLPADVGRVGIVISGGNVDLEVLKTF